MSEVVKRNSRAPIFIICLVIALLFWLLNSMSSQTDAALKIPVQYINSPAGLKQEKPLPEMITVYVKANGFDFLGQKLSGNQPKVKIDLATLQMNYAGPGITEKTIPAELLLKELIANLPDDFNFSRAEPDSVTFRFSKSFSKKVPVKLNLTLHFKKQFMQDGPVILQPDSIVISGTESIIRNYSWIETTPVRFTNADHDLFFSTVLKNPAPADLFFSHPKIWVLVPTGEFTEEKISLPVEKIKIENKLVKLLPAKVNVTYIASLRNYRFIHSEDFKAEVAAVTGSEQKLPVKLSGFPKQVKIVSVEPELVDYYFIEE